MNDFIRYFMYRRHICHLPLQKSEKHPKCNATISVASQFSKKKNGILIWLFDGLIFFITFDSANFVCVYAWTRKYINVIAIFLKGDFFLCNEILNNDPTRKLHRNVFKLYAKCYDGLSKKCCWLFPIYFSVTECMECHRSIDGAQICLRLLLC